ncbi:MAG: GAF and ANTAR domain-containing protein [Aeromicrobium sp.]
MTASSTRALAAVSASLVADHDIAGTLTALVRGCVDALGAACGSVMVADSTGRFELLASSSHEVDELALYESQHHDGPSVRAWQTVTATTMSADGDGWPELSEHMAAAGVTSMLATPLRWNGTAHGALTIFCGHRSAFSEEEQTVVQAFADMAMLVIVHTDRITVRSAAERVEEALSSRVLIEQAKGVLAQEQNVSMAAAFEQLRQIAADEGTMLTEAARTVVRSAGIRLA